MINNPIIFFGTEDFSAVSLQKLIDEKFNIVGIITKPDSKKGRGQKLHAPIVKEIGIKHGIQVLQPQKMTEVVDFVQQFDNPCGVLVSYGKIIPQNIIDLFTPGIINVHPSLLPKYRGPSPIESAIYNGDNETGVSIMQLSARMDAGPVYAQETIEITQETTANTFYNDAGELGAKLLANTLPDIISGKKHPTEQPEEEASYCQLLNKSNSILDPAKMTASQAERQVRAYEIFPKTKLQIEDYTCIINKASVIKDQTDATLKIKFSDNNYLNILELTAPNGKKMTAESFRNGYLK